LSKDPKTYLNDILNHINLAQEFVAQMTYEELTEDLQACYAICRCFEIIGEASMKIPMTLREKYTEVPWSEIISMRNIIVHDYSGVDYLTVWQTLKKSLPELKPQIQKVLSDLK
jgi:uncharacterized protein with HEPN domain